MKKIFIKTFGCSLNQADSETMEGILVEDGFKIIDRETAADLIIINTCTVKGPTETAFFKYLDKFSSTKKVLVTGCIPQSIPENLQEISILGTNQFSKLIVAVNSTLQGKRVSFLDDSSAKKAIKSAVGTDRLSFPKVRKNSVIDIIPISAGCLGNCSYCIVKLARGNLSSYSPKKIVNQAKVSIKDGAKELWLTSQDNGCYGYDFKTDYRLPQLLEDICNIDGNFFIRVGMANPNHVIEIVDKLIVSMDHDNIFKFLHIPLQSGSDKILNMMGRRYTATDFKRLVIRLRKHIPGLTISTDIIVGFPGETQDMFKRSLDIIESVKPDVLNISRFWPRPKTKASQFKQLDGSIIKDRSRVMTTLFKKISLEKNKGWIGWNGIVIIDGIGKDGSFICRNESYKQVIIKPGKVKLKLGDMVKVNIVGATIFYLRGKIIN